MARKHQYQALGRNAFASASKHRTASSYPPARYSAAMAVWPGPFPKPEQIEEDILRQEEHAAEDAAERHRIREESRPPRTCGWWRRLLRRS